MYTDIREAPSVYGHMNPNLDTLIAGVMGQAASISMIDIVSS
jgi:hypothetical protein